MRTGRPAVWDDHNKPSSYNKFLAEVGVNPHWDPMTCIAAIPSGTGAEAIDELRRAHADMMAEKGGRKRPSLEASASSFSFSSFAPRSRCPSHVAASVSARVGQEFEGKPTAVDAPLEERMRELLADRDALCLYDQKLQRARVLHFPAEKGSRLLTHFYAFVFFADWKADLWSKRFVRDHLR